MTLVHEPVSSHPVARASRRDRVSAAVVALDLLAMVLVAAGVAAADFRDAGPAGLVEVLPPSWWAGAAVLVIAFAVSVRGAVGTPVLTLQAVLVVLVLYGTPLLIEPYARNPVGYVHVGLVEHVVHTGELLDQYDARFEWPGAIGLGAAMTSAAGVDSATAFLRWSPIIFVLAWSLPIWVIARTLFGTAEGAAAAVALAAVVNWVGQEYWSPQALSFLLYLSFLALALHHAPPLPPRCRMVPALLGWRTGPAATAWPGPVSPPVVIVSLALLAGAIAVGHQLTPFVLVLGVASTVVVGRRDLGLLPLAVALIAVGWFSWGAVDYWGNATNKEFLTQDVGQVTSVVRAGLLDRVSRGTGLRSIVLGARVAFAGAVWVAAAAVALRGRSSHPTRTTAALAFAPLPLVATQGYGGELILRLFLFSAPFAAILLAPSLVAALRERRRRAVAAGLVLVALVPLFVVCRFGNESFEQIYPEDVAAAEYVRRRSGAGTPVVQANPFSSFRTSRIATTPHRQILDLARPDRHDPVDLLRANGIRDAFVLLTTTQAAYGHHVQGGPADWVDLVVERLVRSGAGKVVFRERDAVVVWVDEP